VVAPVGAEEDALAEGSVLERRLDAEGGKVLQGITIRGPVLDPWKSP
jgi:hypothetical protein